LFKIWPEVILGDLAGLLSSFMTRYSARVVRDGVASVDNIQSP
jgi:hypothetical protein